MLSLKAASRLCLFSNISWAISLRVQIGAIFVWSWKWGKISQSIIHLILSSFVFRNGNIPAKKGLPALFETDPPTKCNSLWLRGSLQWETVFNLLQRVGIGCTVEWVLPPPSPFIILKLRRIHPDFHHIVLFSWLLSRAFPGNYSRYRYPCFGVYNSIQERREKYLSPSSSPPPSTNYIQEFRCHVAMPCDADDGKGVYYRPGEIETSRSRSR